MTPDTFANLPEDEVTHASLVKGRMVREPRPSYGHGRVHARVAHLIEKHIQDQGLELACLVNAGFVLVESPPTVRGPDIAVVHRSRKDTALPHGFIPGAPDLAVEIVTPTNDLDDAHAKVRDYLRAGAQCVWVIHQNQGVVTIHESEALVTFLTTGATLVAGDVLPGFRVPVSAFFEP